MVEDAVFVDNPPGFSESESCLNFRRRVLHCTVLRAPQDISESFSARNCLGGVLQPHNKPNSGKSLLNPQWQRNIPTCYHHWTSSCR